MSRDAENVRSVEAQTGGAAHAGPDLEAEHDPGVARRASNAGLQREAAAVQRKAAAGSEASTGAVHEAAARGTASPTTALPHADKIQASFGSAHDVSGVQAHVGGDSASEMGATAYAAGNHVVFDHQPDLHTAAHEAAHVVQQARGVNLYGGVGEAGDSYEQEADAIADRVVAGESAADLLGPATTAAPAETGAVQQKGKKPADATPAEREKQGETSEKARFDAIRTSMKLTSKRMVDASSTIHEALRGPGTAGGDDVRVEIVRGQFEAVFADVRRIAPLLEKAELSGAYKTNLMPELDMLQGAYSKFALAMQVANQFAGGKKIPLSANPEWIRQLLGGMHTALGSDIATMVPKQPMAAEPEQQLRGEAIVESLSAAYENVRSMRMGAKAGTTAELDSQARNAVTFVKETRALLRPIEADKKALKAHKSEIKKVVTEVTELEKEIAARPALVERAKAFHPHIDELAKLAK